MQVLCNGSPTQQWAFNSNGQFTHSGGLCLDVNAYAAPALVGVTMCSSFHPYQVFVWGADLTLRPNVSSSQCVDVQGARAGNNVALILNNCSGTASQQWRSQDQVECYGFFPGITVPHLRQPYWLVGLAFCLNVALAIVLTKNERDDDSWGSMLKNLVKELVRLGLLGYQCLVVYITAQSTLNMTASGWGRYEAFYFLVLNSSFPANVFLNFKPLFDNYFGSGGGCKTCLGLILCFMQCMLLLLFVPCFVTHILPMCVYYIWAVLLAFLAMSVLTCVFCCGKRCNPTSWSDDLWASKLNNGLMEIIPQAVALWLTTFFNWAVLAYSGFSSYIDVSLPINRIWII